MVVSGKKILYCITKSNWGGAQKYVFELGVATQECGFEVVVALGGAGVLKNKLEAVGIRTISVHALERDVSLTKELTVMRELIRIFKIEKPDVLHLNSSKAGGLGALV